MRISDKLTRRTASARPHLLVTGAHRSGTTWVGKTIALSPIFEYVNEPFNADAKRRFADPGVAEKVDTWYLYAPEYDRRPALETALGERLREIETTPIAAPQAPAGFLPRALGIRRPVPQRKRALLKDPIALMSAPWLYRTFELDVLCTIRNPLAFVGSLKRWNWRFDFRHFEQQQALMDGHLAAFADDIRREIRRPSHLADHAALLWNCLYHVVATYRRRFPGWTFVRYEDLAADPLAGFQGLYTQLGLRMTADISEAIRAHTSAKNPAEPDTSAYIPRDSQAAMNTWRTRLSAEEIDRVVAATRDIAAEFYEWRDGQFA